MQSTWETHKGKKIFFARYGHLTIEDYRAEIDAVEKEMLRQPRDSVLLLVDIAGLIITPEALNLAKNVALHSQPYVRKTALLGMTGARKAIVDIIVKFSGMKVEAFETVEQAKDWLVQG